MVLVLMYVTLSVSSPLGEIGRCGRFGLVVESKKL